MNILKRLWRAFFGRRPAPCSQLPGKLRICRLCGGPLGYRGDGRATLQCRHCGFCVRYNECVLCGGKQSVSLSEDGADCACENCGLVETRSGHMRPGRPSDLANTQVDFQKGARSAE